jgi:electron transfer flavoprotein beta subunit
MDEESGTMVREGVEAIVNPLDLYAVEAALRLAETSAAETIAISMGPPSAAKAIREVISMGVDEGVLLSSAAFAGSDTWATALTLAAAVRRLGDFDLVICGERATDGDTGQVGPEIAAFLDLPVATYVSSIESVADGVVRVRRLIEDGYETLDVELPGVLTVVKEIADPRLPTLRGKLRARAANVPVWGPGDIDLAGQPTGLAGSPTRVVKIFRPRLARAARMLETSHDAALDAAVDEAARFIAERGLL